MSRRRHTSSGLHRWTRSTGLWEFVDACETVRWPLEVQLADCGEPVDEATYGRVAYWAPTSEPPISDDSHLVRYFSKVETTSEPAQSAKENARSKLQPN